VRARIHVLAEIPDEWQRRLEAWSRMNRRHRRRVGRRLAPDRNEESVIYQTMLGAWPLDDRELPDFRARLAEFVVKAVREAGIHSSWTDVDTRWEGALRAFLADLLHDERGRFAAEFSRLRRTIAWHGALNSLSQVVLKIASPGVPDFYQGCELWDFSLVDPDNRRPVDFTARRRALRALERDERRLAAPQLCRRLLASWTDGRIKLFVTRRALRFRRDHRRVFDGADYMRLRATGLGRRHVCAFARRAGRSWIVAVVPRLTTALVAPERVPCGSDVWGGSAVLLPTGAPRRLRDVFTGQARVAEPRSGRHGTGLSVAAILGEFPVALLHG
jgi:(1->4)-alpha-D-glucan 1-alpha-D-glucosylmutase